MSPIPKRWTLPLCGIYAMTLRSPLSMDILRKHDQRQTLPEEGS
jgi:hypothetical protein